LQIGRPDLKGKGHASVAGVKLTGISKAYGAVEVLRDINLEIATGEFVVLLGPSGCGKSTLLRIIAGLEDHDAGDVEIDGRAVDDIEPKDRGVAMVFQSYALYPHMTVRENLCFGLKLRSTPKAEIDRRMGSVVEILGVGNLVERYPEQLSGGQRQRVAMGRALIRDPGVFLFDEPLSNLDAQLRLQLRVEIKKLHQRLGNTAIYVTHDQTEAMTMADRIVVMRGGRIVQADTPIAIYDRPANTFVGQFIGSPPMNLIPGTVGTMPAGTAMLTRSAISLPLPENFGPQNGGREIMYGVRPEHLAFEGEGEGVAGIVTVIEPLGRETLVYCDIGKDQICVAPGGRTTVRPGDHVKIHPAIRSVNLFDGTTLEHL